MPVRAISGRPARGGRRPLTVVNKLRDYSTPPPIGGWNARDSLANMEETEAIELENWFPEETRVRMRNGYASHATGLSGSVDTIMSWNGPSSTKLFAASSADIYDVTSSGAVGSPDVTGLSSAQFQHVMFSVSSGNYLIVVNGSDQPRRYDGTSWFIPTFSGSGLTTSNLIHVNTFKNRLFFVEKNSLRFWFAAVDSVGGTLTKFDLGPQATLGGNLVAMGTWTRDGGDGLDDLAVFITSEGEVILYQGTDPSSASTWSKIGTFRIGSPIGRRCMIKIGAELIVVTEDGFAPLSRQLGAARAAKSIFQSDKISGALQTAVEENRDSFGWQPILYPAGDKLIFNIPQPTGNVQYVSHSATGAWCKFTGWNARCFEVSDNRLYFGGTDGTVYHADTGLNDNGNDITTLAKTAFSYFGSRGLTKNFSMVRPIVQVDGDVDASLLVNVDFSDRNVDSSCGCFTIGQSDGTNWDASEWDEAEWSDEGDIAKDWRDAGAVGNAASLAFTTTHKNGNVQWTSTDWKWEPAANPGYL